MSDQDVLQDLHFSRVLRAAEALTQWRALLASFITFLAAAVIAALGGYLAYKAGIDGSVGTAKFIFAMTALVLFVVQCSGLSAVGVMLMDRARSIPVRSMTDAFFFGLICLPKFIGFALCVIALTIVVVIAAALVYFVCKIPGVGPVLLFVAHPVVVVATAAVYAALLWVGIPLFAPAVWEGRSFSESLSVLHAVAKTRLVTVVAMYLLLFLVVAVIAGLLFSALLPSLVGMTGLAAGILGADVNSLAALPQLFASTLFGGGGKDATGGHLIAIVLAAVILYGAALCLIAQALIMGINLVYLVATDGLDVSASTAALAKGLAQVKQKAAEAQERARQAAEHARQAADRARAQPQAAHAAAAPGRPSAAHCPKCQAVVMADDPFCNECGFKLK